MTSATQNGADFLNNFEEKPEFNQYWYSTNTIARITEEIIALPGSVAFLSTPSLYFALPVERRSGCKVFDYDRAFGTDIGYIFYDFNCPDEVPPKLIQSFDLVVIDPPFITEEVWRKYATTAKLLLKPGLDSNGSAFFVKAEKVINDSLTGLPRGKVILTTIFENAKLLNDLFQAQPTAFLPSIPNLVYQYNLYTNYPSTIFAKKNPEIPE